MARDQECTSMLNRARVWYIEVESCCTLAMSSPAIHGEESMRREGGRN